MLCTKNHALSLLTLLCLLSSIFFPVLAGADCQYRVYSDWPGGFVGSIKITNTTSEEVDNWQVSWQYLNDTEISHSWNTVLTGQAPYVAVNASWNGKLAQGASVEFGFQGKKSVDVSEIPTLYGSLCKATNMSSSVSSSQSSISSFSSISTQSQQSSNSANNSDSSSSISSISRVDNPWADATPYVNPAWSEFANSVPDGHKIAHIPTGIWLENPDDVLNLELHFENAKQQGADLMSLVVYALPNKNCVIHNNYEPESPYSMEYRVNDYRNNIIDALADLFSEPGYQSMRIVVVLEPGAIGNLVTGLNYLECDNIHGPGGHMDALRYALNRFSASNNVYTYLDMVGSSWFGWTENFSRAASVTKSLLTSTSAGWDSIAGFSTNVGRYVPLKEPFLENPNLLVGGVPVRASNFYEWNNYVDELGFAIDWRAEMIKQGAPETLGVLLDTSRNGWGGPDRPVTVSEAWEVDVYVNESRIDRRASRYNWCNQASGIGYRPSVAPHPGIDAYAWLTPPGRSDGSALENYLCAPGSSYQYYPDQPANAVDRIPTEAIDGAPDRGEWFPEALDILIKKAYPPLQ